MRGRLRHHHAPKKGRPAGTGVTRAPDRSTARARPKDRRVPPLTRIGLLRILTELHDELPQRYARFRGLRHPEDERLFLFFVSIADGSLVHTFTFHVDDSTSPE